jgi:hypothetical protein
MVRATIRKEFATAIACTRSKYVPHLASGQLYASQSVDEWDVRVQARLRMMMKRRARANGDLLRGIAPSALTS